MDCPECGTDVGLRKSCACGWKLKPLARGKNLGFEPDHMRCEWTSGMDRCRYVATWSPSTVGGGPWYCRGHSDCANPVLGHGIVEASRAFHIADYTAASVSAATRAAYLTSDMPGTPGGAALRPVGALRPVASVVYLRQPGEEG